MGCRYSEIELSQRFFYALDAFNEEYGSDISEANTILAFFDPRNGMEVYERLCKEHFPKYLKENYKHDGYFDSFAAQAFVNDEEYGVLIRSDIDFPLLELHSMFLHEISHLYCTRNEIHGGNFFDRYCMGSGEEDGMLNAGYAIWREAVADIMADTVWSASGDKTLRKVKSKVDRLNNMISSEDKDSKKYMARIIFHIIATDEVVYAKSWAEAETKIEKCIKFEYPQTVMILKAVFDNLHEPEFWEITPDFIKELGQLYIAMLASKAYDRNYSRLFSESQ